MFGFKSQSAPADARAVSVSVSAVPDLADKPVTAVLQKPPEFTRYPFKADDPAEVAAYVALCEKIGAVTPAVRMLQLEQFLAEKGIIEYDSDQVNDYLCALALTVGPNILYRWHALRKQDNQIKTFRWYWNSNDSKYRCDSSKEVYGKLVPMSVLETVVKIAEAFPDAAFFVSDIPDIDDPFLGVTFEDQELLIIEFWNEPGFKPVG